MIYDLSIDLFQVDKFEDSSVHREFTHENADHKTKNITISHVNKPNGSSPTSFQYSPDYLMTSGGGISFMAGSGKFSDDGCSHARILTNSQM